METNITIRELFISHATESIKEVDQFEVTGKGEDLINMVRDMLIESFEVNGSTEEFLDGRFFYEILVNAHSEIISSLDELGVLIDIMKDTNIFQDI